MQPFSYSSYSGNFECGVSVHVCLGGEGEVGSLSIKALGNKAFIHNLTNRILTSPFKISIILFLFSKEICAD